MEVLHYLKFGLPELLDLCIVLCIGSLIREVLFASFDENRKELQGECSASASSEQRRVLKANNTVWKSHIGKKLHDLKFFQHQSKFIF